ncbi:MAG: hypothetical protein M3326_16730 [Actinomycetota bacterium]|nr:hypothetical protein [Actinomycetota bacterium]
MADDITAGQRLLELNPLSGGSEGDGRVGGKEHRRGLVLVVETVRRVGVQIKRPDWPVTNQQWDTDAAAHRCFGVVARWTRLDFNSESRWPQSVDARSFAAFLLERDDADPDPVGYRRNGQRSCRGDDHDIRMLTGVNRLDGEPAGPEDDTVRSFSRASVCATTARVMARPASSVERTLGVSVNKGRRAFLIGPGAFVRDGKWPGP